MTNKETGKLWSGVMFIILGSIFLLQEFFPALNFKDFWPVLLIITGIIFIYDGYKKLNSDITLINSKTQKNDQQND